MAALTGGSGAASTHQLGRWIISTPRAQASPRPSTRLSTRAHPSNSRANHSPPERGRRTGTGRGVARDGAAGRLTGAT
ncbi:hypothetical protein VB716_07875, partial [Synechococcus sp. CCY9201]|uniref:hypothetical protein n=1 Tax=unclassified Synechococcus TaxID=2626047 RepID=UPI002B1FE602